MLNPTRSGIISGSAATAIAGLALVAFASPASATSLYYPSGPQVDVPRATVENGGWTLCWDESFDGTSDVTNIVAGTDDHSLAPCNSTHLLITGWGAQTPETLTLLATAPRADILTETTVDPVTSLGAARLSNGTWWVFSPGYSMGFGPNSDLSLTPGEHIRNDGTDPQRMSWHMFADDEVSRTTVLRAGWSIGVHDNAANDFHRAIYAETSPAVTTLPNTGADARGSLALAALAMLAGVGALMATRRRRTS